MGLAQFVDVGGQLEEAAVNEAAHALAGGLEKHHHRRCGNDGGGRRLLSTKRHFHRVFQDEQTGDEDHCQQRRDHTINQTAPDKQLNVEQLVADYGDGDAVHQHHEHAEKDRLTEQNTGETRHARLTHGRENLDDAVEDRKRQKRR